MEERALLHEVQFKFSQEANCCDGGDYEEIDIRITSDCGLDDESDGFIVIKTDQWAFNDIDEMKNLFQRCLDAVKTVVKK